MSKVSLGPVDRLHERLQSKGGSYHKWHSSKVHHFVHWVVFVSVAVFVFILGLNSTSNVQAGSSQMTEDNYRVLTLSTNKDTAIANGQDAITVSAKSMVIFDGVSHPGASPENPIPDCNFQNNPPTDPAEFKIAVNGEGNSYNGNLVAIDCTTGMMSVTLTSTSTGTKTIQLWAATKGPEDYNTGLALNVTFTAPPSSSTPTSSGNTGSSTTQKKTTQTPTTSASAPEAASAPPEMSLVKISDNEVDSTTKTANSTVEEGKPIVLSGKTTPNSKVTLYIYSDPIVVETTSDKDGFWSYEIASLPPGDHRVEAAVTDSAGKTSGKAEIAKFVVAEAQSVEKTDKVLTPKSNNNMLYLLIAIGVVLLAVIGGVVFYVRKKKRPVQG